jgi:excisionase family DNA binding protein
MSTQQICKLFDVKTAAHLLSVSQPTLRRLIKSQLLSHRRIGDRVLMTIEDLESFLNSCAVPKKGGKK